MTTHRANSGETTMNAGLLRAAAASPGLAWPSPPAASRRRPRHRRLARTQPRTPGHYVGVGSCVNSGCHGSTSRSTPPRPAERVLHLAEQRPPRRRLQRPAQRPLRAHRPQHAPEERTPAKSSSASTATPPTCRGASRPAPIDIEDGIQCEVCHGPAGGWRAEHTEKAGRTSRASPAA